MADYFDICRNYHGGNAESVAAFRSMERMHLINGQRIYALAVKCGIKGVTCDEAEIALELRHQTCSARITFLKVEEKVFATKWVRPTRSGRNARVLIADVFLDEYNRNW